MKWSINIRKPPRYTTNYLKKQYTNIRVWTFFDYPASTFNHGTQTMMDQSSMESVGNLNPTKEVRSHWPLYTVRVGMPLHLACD